MMTTMIHTGYECQHCLAISAIMFNLATKIRRKIETAYAKIVNILFNLQKVNKMVVSWTWMFIFVSTIPYLFCMLYRSKEGCQACGKKLNKIGFNIEDIQSFFGPAAISRDLCHNCVCSIKRWRRQRLTSEVTIVKQNIYLK